MGLLDGKTALIFGVANDHSIAWGIAKALREQGASVGFSSIESLLERRVRPLAEELGSTFVAPCDVRDDARHHCRLVRRHVRGDRLQAAGRPQHVPLGVDDPRQVGAVQHEVVLNGAGHHPGGLLARQPAQRLHEHLQFTFGEKGRASDARRVRCS